MGMDAVELVIRFEDAFGIRIPDGVAAQLTTPGKVTDYVLAQVAVSKQSSCLSQQAFYFLRRKFLASTMIARGDLRPSTRLEALVPMAQRRQVWAGIKSEIGRSALPDLARPIWLIFTLSLLTVLTFISAFINPWSKADMESKERGLDVEATKIEGTHFSHVASAMKQSIEFFRKTETHQR